MNLPARLAALALAATVISGCGGTDKPAVGDGSPPSLDSLADTIGCTNVQPDTELLGVREGGSCTMGGRDVFLYTYSTAKQQEDLHDVSRLGGGVWVVGDRWEAQAPNTATADKVAEATGGEVE